MRNRRVSGTGLPFLSFCVHDFQFPHLIKRKDWGWVRRRRRSEGGGKSEKENRREKEATVRQCAEREKAREFFQLVIKLNGVYACYSDSYYFFRLILLIFITSC